MTCGNFGGIVALYGAELTLQAGEIHALIGENGAGKSTMINIATGVQQPDRGTLTLKGEQVEFPRPRRCRTWVSVVHQERNLVANSRSPRTCSLALPLTGGLVNYRRMVADARPWLEQVGLDVDPLSEARRLSPGQAQLTEIAKALADARCSCSTATSSITEGEFAHLFDILRDLRDRGTASCS